MPLDDVQDCRFATFTERREALLEKVQREERPLNALQAEAIVLAEREEQCVKWNSSQEVSNRA
jgi:hypothetical protein